MPSTTSPVSVGDSETVEPQLISATADNGRFSSSDKYVMPSVGTTAMGGDSIPTMNKFGWQFPIDIFSALFVEDAVTNSSAQYPALELAAAYGVATPQALMRGAHMIANDLSAQHLTVLSQRIPSADRSRLTLLHGAFPNQISSAIAPASLSTVLAANLLHFFDGPTISDSLQTMKRWVRPGGAVYIVAFSVHHRFSNSYSELYEEARQRGDTFPGCQYRDDVVARIKTEPLTSTFTAEKRAEIVQLFQNVPSLLHFMDDEVLPRLVRESGFDVVRCEYFPCAPNISACNDGREMIGCIARRPITDQVASKDE